MTRHLTHVALALLTSLTTWSCATQASDDVRIGAPLALTGSLADEGKKQALAYDMWLARVNAAGGIEVDGQQKKVTLVTYDYQSDSKRAQQLAEKLITDDKVHVVMAPFGSGHTKIVAGVAERYRRTCCRIGRIVRIGLRPGLQESVWGFGAQLRPR